MPSGEFAGALELLERGPAGAVDLSVATLTAVAIAVTVATATTAATIAVITAATAATAVATVAVKHSVGMMVMVTVSRVHVNSSSYMMRSSQKEHTFTLYYLYIIMST